MINHITVIGGGTMGRGIAYTAGEKYRPFPLLVKYVKAGRLGRKSGRGFFDYTKK